MKKKKKKTFRKTFCNMQNVLELQFLVDDLVDFLKLSMFINKRMTMSKKYDRSPYQKSMFSITNKGAGLSLDI